MDSAIPMLCFFSMECFMGKSILGGFMCNVIPIVFLVWACPTLIK